MSITWSPVPGSEPRRVSCSPRIRLRASATVSTIRATRPKLMTPRSIRSVWCLGRQGQRVQFTMRAVHLALERGIDGALLLHAVHALERGVNHFGGIVVPVACQIGDGDLGVGKSGADQVLDFLGLHWHGASPVNPVTKT